MTIPTNARACCPECGRTVTAYRDDRGTPRLHFVWHTRTGTPRDDTACEASGWLVEDVELLIAEMSR